MNHFILLFFLSITNATSNNLRVNKPPKPECDKRSTRNAYRNAHGNGCIQTATLEWKKMRRKCIKVADDAAERAGDMVIDMADAEERRLSDKLIDEAATTLDKTLNDIQSNTDDAVAKLDTDFNFIHFCVCSCLPGLYNMLKNKYDQVYIYIYIYIRWSLCRSFDW